MTSLAWPSANKENAKGKKLSAMQWLMEVAVNSQELRYLPMFRIDAEEVRSELGLSRRKSKLYSLNEISENWGRVRKQVDRAIEKEPRDRSFKERKLVELDSRTRQYTLTAASFGLPIPEEIPAEEFEKVFPGADEQTRQMFALRELENRMNALKNMTAPAIVAPGSGDDRGRSAGPSLGCVWLRRSLTTTATWPRPERKPIRHQRAGIETFSEMIKAYGDQRHGGFQQGRG